jgi:hypothetical protein
VASGQTLLEFSPLGAETPATNFPQFDIRNNHPVLDFDQTTEETCYFTAVLPRNYDGAGVTVTLHVTSALTTGTSRWLVAFERLTAQDVDADGFATANSAACATNATAGIPTATTIAFTNGAQMDSVVGGDLFRLSVARDADGTTGTDDLAGDAELLMVEIRET